MTERAHRRVEYLVHLRTGGPMTAAALARCCQVTRQAAHDWLIHHLLLVESFVDQRTGVKLWRVKTGQAQ